MTESSTNLTDCAHSKFLAAQRLYRLVDSIESEVKRLATVEEYDQLRNLINELDELGFQKLVDLIREREFESLPTMKLRNLARSLSVPYYMQMDRMTLLSAITIRKREIDGYQQNQPPSNSSRVDLQSS